MTTDPLGLAEDVEAAGTRLLNTARALPDAAAPSALPDWTVGHVLTHVARNADSLTNLLTWARTGVVTPQYPSREARTAGIAAGAHRPMPEQLADLEQSTASFAAAVAAMPPAGWLSPVQPFAGPEVPAARVVWLRLKEVEIHHVDLGAGYGPADWPTAFAVRMLRVLAQDLADRPDWPRLRLRAPEVGRDLTIGADGPLVSGPAWAMVGWLTGRAEGAELTGPLPARPVWS